MSSREIPVFILSYNRPIYLWACLDSLYRNTRYPAKFILADNCSTDLGVIPVIEGFLRRRMLYSAERFPQNRPDRLELMLRQHLGEIGKYFAFVESDVAICDDQGCWLSRMVLHMERNRKLWMLGSQCLTSDFVDASFAKIVDPTMPQAQFDFLVKPTNLERNPVLDATGLIEPHNPPGRLLLFRSECLAHIAIQPDVQMYHAIRALGYEAKIASDVLHRHLSLLNFFDYSGSCGEKRDIFFQQMGQNGQVVVQPERL